MSMKRKHSIAMLRVSALTALVTASTLGAVVFFAAPAEGAEKTHQTEEMTQYEEAQGKAKLEDDAAANPDNGGIAHCLLVGVNGSSIQPDQLNNVNTLRIPLRLCQSFVYAIEQLIDQELLTPEQLLFKQVY